MKGMFGAMLAAALLPALSLASSSVDAVPDRLQSWAAPPYWAPPAVSNEEQNGRSAQATGRHALSPGPVALPFFALPPCRLVDTRGNAPLTGGFLPAATIRSYTLTGVCNIPSNAKAISLNATVTNTVGPGFLELWPEGEALPGVSTLNFVAGQTIANAAVVSLSASGGISMVFGVSGADVILDTNGYYASTPSVTSLNTLSGDVTLAAGTNVSITPSANTLMIAATPGSGGPPTGTAGGSLSGTYPNPGIAAGAVGPSQLANGTAVRSINGAAQDLVTLQGSGNVSVSTAGSTITIGAPSGSMVLGAPGDTTLIGAGYREIASTSIFFWTATTTTNAPLARYLHTAVWTGSRMIVWGGVGVGGVLNDGGQYDPVSDAWTAMTTTGAPSGRRDHTAVWTGSRMIVWGGLNPYIPGSPLNDGGQYDPVANSWTPTAAMGAPSGRIFHSVVWTGSRMIVWGGSNFSFDSLNDGGLFDPVANVWTATATAGAPPVRERHTAVWTGARMIVWGGFHLGTVLNDGGQYDPVANVWTATATAGAPSARYVHTAVWTGSSMVVWGGFGTFGLNDGGQYEPVANVWTAMTTTGAPSARYVHTAVWTGSRMIVWGGYLGSNILNDGGQWATVSLYRKN